MDSCTSALACTFILRTESFSIPDTYVKATREHTFTKHSHYITQTQSYISPTTNTTSRPINPKNKNWYLKPLSLLLLPLPPHHPPKITPRLSHTPLHPVNGALPIPPQWPLALNGVPILVLAAALRTVDPFLRHGVAERLRDAALAHGAADQPVDAVLQVVDLGDAGDFGFVEVFWEGVRWV